MTLRLRSGQLAARLAVGGLVLAPLACGSDGNGNLNDEQTLREALHGFGQYSVVRLDTAALAQAVQAGQAIRLPFGRGTGGGVARECD
jgi:hypothetical protein